MGEGSSELKELRLRVDELTARLTALESGLRRSNGQLHAVMDRVERNRVELAAAARREAASPERAKSPAGGKKKGGKPPEGGRPSEGGR